MACTSSLIIGCATLVKGSAQTIHVQTEPAGAHCTFIRQGQLVTEIPTTPATISVFKEEGQLILRCNKSGYLEARWEAGSSFQDMVLGNIIFGGIIGAAVDAGSGAMYEYPDSIRLTLIPERFGSEDERDRFFDELRIRVVQESEDSIRQVRQSCDEHGCEDRINMLLEARERALQDIERKRQAASVEQLN